MTEIPEHLLKRSRERRSAMGGESAAPAEGGSTPAKAEAAAPAPRPAAAAPAPAAPKAEAPRPVPAYVAAYQSRRKIPIWVSPVLALLPVWLFLFVNAVTKQPKEVVGPLAEGAAVYTQCASCHAANGSGGVGYPLANGEVIKSFPNIADQIRFIYNGNRPYVGQVYTPADREGGPHTAGVRGVAGAMPAFGSGQGGALTDAEILAVVCHERFGMAPAELETTYAEEFETWCSGEAANWVAVEEGGFEAIDLDVSEDIQLPTPAEAGGGEG